MKSKDYDQIPTKANLKAMNFPGVYCKKCGTSYALYSFSMFQPNGFDENDKAYYDWCFACQKKIQLRRKKMKKNKLIDRSIAAGIILLTGIILSAFVLFIYVFYNAYINENNPNSLVKNQIVIPYKATNLEIIGENWYSFEYNGSKILLHKKVSYLTGTSAESMTFLGKVEN